MDEKYDCAIEYFSKSPETFYYNGLALLGLENFEEAIKFFLIFQRENPKHPGVNWYLGLTYIQLDRLNMASMSLNNLLHSENSYRTDAQKLLEKIEKMKTAERK